MILRGIRVSFDGELGGALAIIEGESHVGAASQEGEGHNNNTNISQFFSLSTEFTS
jgi:hypothetical protein